MGWGDDRSTEGRVYLEINEGFPGHRKTLRLCSALQDTRAGWYMIRLWTWACRSCPSGDLTGMSPYDIEIAVGYAPMDGKCYQAMVGAGGPGRCGFIEESTPGEPSVIHDWMEHTGGAIKRMEESAADKKRWRAHKDRKCTSPCRWCDKELANQQDVDRMSVGRRPDVDGRGTGQTNTDQTRQVQSRQGKASPDKSSPDQTLGVPDPEAPFPDAEGNGPDITNGHDLIHALRVAMEDARPRLGLYNPGRFAEREAQAFLDRFGANLAMVQDQIRERIAAFVASDKCAPWTVTRFSDKYNELGAETASCVPENWEPGK